MPFSSPTANDIPNKTARALPPGVKPNRNRQNLSAALPRAQSISPGSKAAFFSFTEGIAPRLAGKGDHVRAQKRCRPRFPRAAEVLRPASGQRQPFRSGSGSLFNPPFPRKKKKTKQQTNQLALRGEQEQRPRRYSRLNGAARAQPVGCCGVVPANPRTATRRPHAAGKAGKGAGRCAVAAAALPRDRVRDRGGPVAAVSSLTRNNPTAEPCESCPRNGTTRRYTAPPPLPPSTPSCPQLNPATHVSPGCGGRGAGPAPAPPLPYRAREEGGGAGTRVAPAPLEPGGGGVVGAGEGRGGTGRPRPRRAARHAGSGSGSAALGVRRAAWQPPARGERAAAVALCRAGEGGWTDRRGRGWRWGWPAGNPRPRCGSSAPRCRP